jgi:mevalonate kinase
VEAISNEALATLSADVLNWDTLRMLVSANQGILDAIGVGHAVLTQVCLEAQARGFVAKLTGAGGGGCAFVLLPSGDSASAAAVADLREALASRGFDSFETTVGGPGVLVH